MDSIGDPGEIAALVIGTFRTKLYGSDPISFTQAHTQTHTGVHTQDAHTGPNTHTHTHSELTVSRLLDLQFIREAAV